MRVDPPSNGRFPEYDSPVRYAAVLAAVVLLALVAAGASSANIARVTVIGDSVATAMAYQPAAKTLLGQGVDARLDLDVCRRTAAASCPYKGQRPPTVLDLATDNGSALGAVVVVAVGYNDYQQTFEDDVESALAAFRKAGVQRVLWLTLRAQRQSYAAMNDDLVAVAARHPELTVVDWNAAARGHEDWVQDDGIHMTDVGAVQMATLIHDTLVKLGIALPPVTVSTTKLPWAKERKEYAALLAARGGSPPYRWVSLTRTPKGLHLAPDGRLFGTPRSAGTFPLSFRVQDAQGVSATLAVRLRVVT